MPRKLLDSIPAVTLRDLRDRALIATLIYSFARITAAQYSPNRSGFFVAPICARLPIGEHGDLRVPSDDFGESGSLGQPEPIHDRLAVGANEIRTVGLTCDDGTFSRGKKG